MYRCRSSKLHISYSIRCWQLKLYRNRHKLNHRQVIWLSRSIHSNIWLISSHRSWLSQITKPWPCRSWYRLHNSHLPLSPPTGSWVWRWWQHEVVGVFTTELCQTLSVCVRHLHVTKISIWRAYTKFKWRQFEYHSAIQSLKHLIWESWMMQYGHVYTAFCIIIKLKVMFWKLYTRIDFNVGTFKYKDLLIVWARSGWSTLLRDGA